MLLLIQNTCYPSTLPVRGGGGNSQETRELSCGPQVTKKRGNVTVEEPQVPSIFSFCDSRYFATVVARHWASFGYQNRGRPAFPPSARRPVSRRTAIPRVRQQKNSPHGWVRGEEGRLERVAKPPAAICRLGRKSDGVVKRVPKFDCKSCAAASIPGGRARAIRMNEVRRKIVVRPPRREVARRPARSIPFLAFWRKGQGDKHLN